VTPGGAPGDAVPVPALLARMRAGDRDAARLVCERLEPFLRRVARRWLSPAVRRQADSMDIVQSVLRRVVGGAAPSDLADDGRVLAWAATVVRNRVRTLARRKKDLGGDAVEAGLAEETLPALAEDPAEAAACVEDVTRFREALAALSEDEQNAVLLHDFDGLEFGMVAEVLGRPSADAARKLHQRALARLRKALVGRRGSG
jgi:RNA polymerase sigma factor (sigma-70 family)